MLAALVAALVFPLTGHSVQGRPIRLVERDGARSGPTVLVVGCIHGSEDAGIAVTKRLLRGPAPAAGRLLVIQDLNPDGRRLGVRVNARGVDLNRNFPSQWHPIGRRGDPQYAGPRPLSEPETRFARAVVRRYRPDVSVWFHQPQAVVRAWGPSIPVARRYARAARAPFRRIPWPLGTASNWQNHAYPSRASFVVELPAGPLGAASARRHARAIRAFL
ncbi:MAG TPA: M14 family zinc carboxypeptidase [Solirubrobacteraceae bacterium]